MSFRPSFRLNLIASWLDHGLGLLVGLLLMPFVLHTIGDKTYGVWLFLGSIAGYSGLLRLGFGDAIGRYVAKHHARQEWDQLNRVVNVILAVYFCMSCVALLVAGVLAWLAPTLHDWSEIPLSEARLVILILGINVSVGIVGGVFGGILVGIQRFDLDLGISIVATVIRLSLTFGFLSNEGGLLTLSLILLAVTIVENLIYVIYALTKVRTLSFGRRYLDRSTLRECCSFSGFAFIHGISHQLINATDTIIIGIFFGAQAIVPYYIALRLCQFISKPIEYIGMVSLPRAGELHAKSEIGKLQQLVIKGLGLAVALTMGFFIGAAFFGRTLIETWMGSGYENSHVLLMVLLGSRMIATPVGVLRSVLCGIGQVRAPALIYLLEAAANLILTLILVKPLGLLGVALGTAIPVVFIELGMLLPFALRQLQFDAGRLIRDVLSPLVVPLTALWLYSFVVVSIFPPAVGWIDMFAVSIGGGTVLVAVWYVGMRSRKWMGAWQSAEV